MHELIFRQYFSFLSTENVIKSYVLCSVVFQGVKNWNICLKWVHCIDLSTRTGVMNCFSNTSKQLLVHPLPQTQLLPTPLPI